MPPMMAETAVARNYLERIFSLPWKEESKDLLDLKRAAKLLDEDHYGLAKIKERILEYLAVRILAPEAKAPIIALWDRPVSVKPALPVPLPVHWTENSPVFLWEGSMMKPRSADTAGPISVPCRGVSLKPSFMQKQKPPASFG